MARSVSVELALAVLGYIISLGVGLWGMIKWALGKFEGLYRSLDVVKKEYVRRDDHQVAITGLQKEIELLRPRVHELANELMRNSGQLDLLIDRFDRREVAEKDHHAENQELLTAILTELRNGGRPRRGP